MLLNTIMLVLERASDNGDEVADGLLKTLRDEARGESILHDMAEDAALLLEAVQKGAPTTRAAEALSVSLAELEG